MFGVFSIILSSNDHDLKDGLGDQWYVEWCKLIIAIVCNNYGNNNVGNGLESALQAACQQNIYGT